MRPFYRRGSQVPGANWRLAQLWLPLYCTGAVLVAGVVAGAVLQGPTGAIGAMAGVGVVMVSYTLSMLVIAWADAMKTSWVLPLGVLTYVVKFAVIGGVLASASQTDWNGMTAMGLGVLAGVVTWIAAQIVALNRYNRVVDAAPAEAGVPAAVAEE